MFGLFNHDQMGGPYHQQYGGMGLPDKHLSNGPHGYQTYSFNPMSGLMGDVSHQQPQMQPQQQQGYNTGIVPPSMLQGQRPTGLFGIRPMGA